MHLPETGNYVLFNQLPVIIRNKITMNLNERLDELRNLYAETKDERWLHRYNECQYIREQMLVVKFSNQINNQPKYDPLEHQKSV